LAGARGRTTRQASASGLLATKLYVPRQQSGFVSRPRLLQELDEGLTRDLILICAPAGFGKTALLAEWARRGRRPVAWLSLDAGDNDAARFWRHAVAALDRVRGGTSERIAPLLGPPPPGSFEGLVTVLINDLAAQADEGEIVLILDDYHLIEAEPVHESLLLLLEHEPAGLHPVIASRADPPLALARLRGRGQLAELRAAELRFTSQEAAELLREAVGTSLPEPAAEMLVERTEGWVAGLQLAGLSLRDRYDVDRFVAAFSGSHRYVLDYLSEEVLERQPDQVYSFLLETSVLETLSGELCDAVTGRTDGQAMLEAIERSNLFLLALDDVRGWWRYHHLFADVLRARLQHEHPERIPTLHRNAAAWSDEHGLADDAVGHALAAGDAPWAARLIERHFDALFLMGERATIDRWLAALPVELVRSRPRLCLVQTFMAIVGGDVEAIEKPMDAAERAHQGAADEPFYPTVGRATSWLGNIAAGIAIGRAFRAYLRGDAEATVESASRALAELDGGQSMLESVARWHLAIADQLRGRLQEAERALTASIEEWSAAGELGLAAASAHNLGQVQREQGRLDAALGTYRHTLELTAAPGRPAPPAAGIAYVGMGQVAYERNELDAALRHISEGIALCRQGNYSPPLATGLAALAWIRQAQGDPVGALETMNEAERVGPSPTVASLINPVPAERARLLLAQGDVVSVLRWTEERGLAADGDPSYPREEEYLVLARVLLAQGLPEQALGLLERLHTAAAAQDRIGSLIEVGMLQALALAAHGDEAAAVAALAEALALACPQGYVRVFADEGPAMGALLGRLVAAQRREEAATRRVPLGCISRLTRAVEQSTGLEAPHGRRSTPVISGLVEPLSERELEVLRLLAAGKRNQEIADELYVVLDTVKKHVTHVLSKLGAANRTEATARARELGLLP
jgi:LuxR family maltose regulon positive regulatory protein